MDVSESAVNIAIACCLHRKNDTLRRKI